MAVKMVCSQCGSDNVLLDAWAYWDVDRQEWGLRQVFDEAYCEECGGPTKLDEVALPEESGEPDGRA